MKGKGKKNPNQRWSGAKGDEHDWLSSQKIGQSDFEDNLTHNPLNPNHTLHYMLN